MGYKVAIVDDSTADACYVQEVLERWAAQRGIGLFAERFSSGEGFLFRYAEEKDYDILLLDIEMEELDGVTVARQVRQENEGVQIIFITGYSEYIAEGYEVAALHYLMKPLNEEKLWEVLDRAAEKLSRNERFLNLDLSSEMVRIPFHEVRYLDVNQNYVTVHGRQDYTVRSTLGEFSKQLDDRFFRVGRSAIVNLAFISRVTRTEIYLADGTRVPLPRGVYEQLNRAIISQT